MLVDLGPDWNNQIVNTDHIVRLEIVEYGAGDDRCVEEIANSASRWRESAMDAHCRRQVPRCRSTQKPKATSTRATERLETSL